MARRVATFVSWDRPDDQAVVVHWKERDVKVVFPIAWAHQYGDRACHRRTRERVLEIEKRAGRPLAPGSVLLAFSRHLPRTVIQTMAPEVPVRLI